jgi:hypothetical protein
LAFNSPRYNKKPSDRDATGLDPLISKGRGEPFERIKTNINLSKRFVKSFDRYYLLI